jgi:hypothetical protein
MLTQSRAEIQAFFEKNAEKHRTFQKHVIVYIRYAIEKELVFTMVNGKLETIKQAQKGDYVILNPTIGGSGERYVREAAAVRERYDIMPDTTVMIEGSHWYQAQSKGFVKGFVYEGEPIRFEAPWGEAMILEPGDFLANSLSDGPDFIYRIEAGAFRDTYQPAEA